MKRAKIVCTMGPASGDEKTVCSMVRQGMDVARFNFSHGTHEDHRRYINTVRNCAKHLGKPVAILQDLQGIKIRIGKVEAGEIVLRAGSKVILRQGNGISGKACLYIDYPGFYRDLKSGHRVLIDDGLILLRVTGKKKGDIIARVVDGGRITDRKGVNLPDTKIGISSFTAKDRKDLDFGIRMGVDYVAVSFVRSAGDVQKVQDHIRAGNKCIPVIAKIEKPEALDNIKSILKTADGIMIARGDLGVEMPPEDVPVIQKELIRLANIAGKIVITATQMLEPMINHSRPTRAEVTDVANAVIDGTDALMLSGETSSGKYPVKAVRMMRKVIESTEKSIVAARPLMRSDIMKTDYPYAVADAAVRAAHDIKARAIIAFTHLGNTARLVSGFRPRIPIIAFATTENIRRNLNILWGVQPEITRRHKHADTMVAEVEKFLLQNKYVRKGDTVVVIASSPLSISGKTNFMKLHKIGE